MPASLALDAVLVFVGGAVLAAVLWAQGLPFTNDEPQHAFAAFVHAHYSDIARGYSRWLDLNDAPSARGYFEIFTALERVLPWEATLRVAHVVVAEVWALSYFALVACLAPARRRVGLVAFPFALQLAFYHGLVTFCLGTAFGFTAIAAWLALPPSAAPTGRRVGGRLAVHGAVACSLYLAARCQVPATSLAGVVLGLVTLARSRAAKSAAAELAGLAIAAAPALWVMHEASSTVSALAAGSDVRDLAWAPVLSRTLLVESYFQPGAWWRAVVTLLLVGIGLVAAGRRGDRVERVLAGAALVLVVATAVLPRDIAGWQLAGERLLPLGTMLAIALIDVERAAARVRRAVLAMLALYSVAVFAFSTWFHLELRRSFAPVAAALDVAPAEPMDFLPIVTEPYGARGDVLGIPDLLPLAHVGQLFAMSYGGVAEYGQVSLPAIHPVVRKRDTALIRPPPFELTFATPKQDGEARDLWVRRMLAYAAAYDGVLLVGRPRDLAVARDAGFMPHVENAAVLFGRFVGCEGEVRITPAPGAARTPRTVLVGWWPLREPAQSFPYLATGATTDVVHVRDLGCGPVWLVVQGARCEEGEPSRADWRRDSVPGANVLECHMQ